MIPVSPAIILGVVLAFVLAIAGASWKAYDAGEASQLLVDQAEVAQQKQEAARELLYQMSKTNEAERKLALNVSQQEVKDGLNSNAIDDLSAQLRTAARGGRLRDPNGGRGACGSGAAGTAARSARPGQDNGAEAPGLLSAELTGLLQRLQREADDINNAYASCRAERWSLQQTLNARTASGTKP